MLESIMTSLKSEVGGKLMSQTSLPERKIDKVFSIIGDVTKKEVAGQMLSGNLSSVMNLFSNKQNTGSAYSIQSNITSGVVTKLTSKLGLTQEISKTIAATAIPVLINLITTKNNTTPDEDPSTLNELFGGGSKGGLLGGFAKKLAGSFKL